MRRIVVFILLIVAFGLGVGAGSLGILYSTGRLTEPSQSAADVAPTLDINAPTPTPGVMVQVQNELAAMNAKVDGLSTQVAGLDDSLSTAVAGGIGVPDAAESNGAAENAPVATPEVEAAANLEGGRALFRIVEDESETRFIIDETFGGAPNTVVGTSGRLAGDVIVNFDDVAASQVGAIAINARVFRTDQDERNQSVRGHILETDTYEFINFEPVELIGLPSEPVAAGEVLEFQIRGNLTIKETTTETVFDATVTLESATRISGLASVTVLWADYGIHIEPPPLISDVSDEVTLEIDFVAEQVEE